MTKYFSSLLVGWQGSPITLGQKVPMELESVLGINTITLGLSWRSCWAQPVVDENLRA